MMAPTRFENQNVADRVDRLRSRLDELGCDSMLVTHLPNVRWLSGFTGSNGFIVVSADQQKLYTDARYEASVAAELAESESSFEPVVSTSRGSDLYEECLKTFTRIGFEAKSVTWDQHQSVAYTAQPGDLIPTYGVCEQLRRTKDIGEQNLLRHAAWIADEALSSVIPALVPGSTERDVAFELDTHMRKLGADGPAYETIVASGPHSALPHATPTDRAFEAGDLLVIDVGARFCDYGSDMTRTFVVGADPTADQLRWYEAVDEAQRAGVAALSNGVDESEIDAVCRRVLAGYGLEEAFVHGTGHGIGLEIHEDPVLSPRSLGTLHSGLVITVEPGVYFPGAGGVRIEDAVVMGENRCSVITNSPKSLQPQPTS